MNRRTRRLARTKRVALLALYSVPGFLGHDSTRCSILSSTVSPLRRSTYASIIYARGIFSLSPFQSLFGCHGMTSCKIIWRLTETKSAAELLAWLLQLSTYPTVCGLRYVGVQPTTTQHTHTPAQMMLGGSVCEYPPPPMSSPRDAGPSSTPELPATADKANADTASSPPAGANATAVVSDTASTRPVVRPVAEHVPANVVYCLARDPSLRTRHLVVYNTGPAVGVDMVTLRRIFEAYGTVERVACPNPAWSRVYVSFEKVEATGWGGSGAGQQGHGSNYHDAL